MVTVVTLFTNLAMAVAAGISINLISYAVKSGETVRLIGNIFHFSEDRVLPKVTYEDLYSSFLRNITGETMRQDFLKSDLQVVVTVHQIAR